MSASPSASHGFHSTHMPATTSSFNWTDCRHIYLDVGSNIGVQIRKLFEPHRYPNAKVLEVFRKYFGSDTDARRREVCAVGFEP